MRHAIRGTSEKKWFVKLAGQESKKVKEKKNDKFRHPRKKKLHQNQWKLRCWRFSSELNVSIAGNKIIELQQTYLLFTLINVKNF